MLRSLVAVAFRKKTYTLARLTADVAALVARAGDVAAATRDMEPAFREQVMLAVARTNDCRYCIFAHTDAGRHAGLTDADLARIEGMEPSDFDHRTWTAIAYAHALAQADFGPLDGDIVADVVALHGDDGRRRIEAAARLMTVSNLTGNTVDALVSRLRGDPAPGAHLCDEIAIASIWLVGAAVTVLNILRARPQSPLALLGELRAMDTATT